MGLKPHSHTLAHVQNLVFLLKANEQVWKLIERIPSFGVENRVITSGV